MLGSDNLLFEVQFEYILGTARQQLDLLPVTPCRLLFEKKCGIGLLSLDETEEGDLEDVFVVDILSGNVSSGLDVTFLCAMYFLGNFSFIPVPFLPFFTTLECLVRFDSSVTFMRGGDIER